MKLWNLSWLNLGAQGGFGVFAQAEELGVAVEVAVGLAGGAVGEALDLFLGEGVGKDDVVFEDFVGVGGLEFAGLKFGVDKGSGGAEEAEAAGFRTWPSNRFVGLHDVFGVEAPGLRRWWS